MARYVDGYVLPVPKKNLETYRRIALKAGRIWREHGALEYRECVGDDLDVKMLVPFPRRIKRKRGETWCSRGSYSSRARIVIASTPG
jgi:uncharacterized protein YbaA (DUF1428 family)